MIARERLALNQFLSQIDNPQVAFSVRQRHPQTVDEAASAPIEVESYVGQNCKPTSVGTVPMQVVEHDEAAVSASRHTVRRHRKLAVHTNEAIG